jgi:DNA-binding PadR family transcriptional regulator
MARDGLSDYEHLVLLAVLRLGEGAYGVPILDEIAARTGRAPSRPAVYVALRRLEQRKYLTSRLGEPSATRGGRAKRFFTVTPAGLRQLQESREAFLSMWANVVHRLKR